MPYIRMAIPLRSIATGEGLCAIRKSQNGLENKIFATGGIPFGKTQ